MISDFCIQKINTIFHTSKAFLIFFMIYNIKKMCRYCGASACFNVFFHLEEVLNCVMGFFFPPNHFRFFFVNYTTHKIYLWCKRYDLRKSQIHGLMIFCFLRTQRKLYYAYDEISDFLFVSIAKRWMVMEKSLFMFGKLTNKNNIKQHNIKEN